MSLYPKPWTLDPLLKVYVRRDRLLNPDHLLQESWQRIERKHIRPVARREHRVGMDLHKEAIDARRHGGPGEVRDELGLSRGGVSCAAGQLQTVGGIEHHRKAEATHHRA